LIQKDPFFLEFCPLIRITGLLYAIMGNKSMKGREKQGLIAEKILENLGKIFKLSIEIGLGMGMM